MKKIAYAPSAKKARVLNSTTIYEGPVFGIRRDEVIEPSGVRAIREVITHPGSVVVLPVLPDGKILLIQQYRHATRQYLWELVAGRMDPGETPRVAAAGSYAMPSPSRGFSTISGFSPRRSGSPGGIH